MEDPDPSIAVSHDDLEVRRHPSPSVELEAALAAANQRFRDACVAAREALGPCRAGPLPKRSECSPEQQVLLDGIRTAERELDRLRRLLWSDAAARHQAEADPRQRG